MSVCLFLSKAAPRILNTPLIKLVIIVQLVREIRLMDAFAPLFLGANTPNCSLSRYDLARFSNQQVIARLICWG